MSLAPKPAFTAGQEMAVSRQNTRKRIQLSAGSTGNPSRSSRASPAHSSAAGRATLLRAPVLTSLCYKQRLWFTSRHPEGAWPLGRARQKLQARWRGICVAVPANPGSTAKVNSGPRGIVSGRGSASRLASGPQQFLFYILFTSLSE